MPWRPTCFDCIQADIDPGDHGCHTLPNGDPGWPGEQASIYNCPEMKDDDENGTGIEDPESCKSFIPKIVTECQICHKKIGVPEYQHDKWGSDGYGDFPVCSDRCKTKAWLKANIYRWKENIYNWKLEKGIIEEYVIHYCPCCQIELRVFEDDELSWWIKESSGKLFCFCNHCEQEVNPRTVYGAVSVVVGEDGSAGPN